MWPEDTAACRKSLSKFLCSNCGLDGFCESKNLGANMNSTKVLGRWALMIFSGAMVVLATACANSTTTTSTPTTEYILAYTHSADYSTYKVDWLEKYGSTYTLKTNQISVNPSSGLRSPTFIGDYILLVDSSTTGRLLVYSKTNNTLLKQINVGTNPQDMVVVSSIAYIANGATGTNLLKRVDLSKLPEMTLLSDITVGNQPSVVRVWNNRIYVGNQDWNLKTQATVSVINPGSTTVASTFNTGANVMDIAYDGTRIWTQNADWYNGSFVCQQASTLTYATGTTFTPSTVTPPAPYTTNSGCSKGGIAFNSSSGFAAMRHSSGSFHLFAINGTTLNSTPIDTTNRYRFVGASSTYLFKIHNGDGSTNNLTTTIEDMSGSVLTTQTLTKDLDMYFFANQQ